MDREKATMPLQPIEPDDHGVLRFVSNRIVEALLETSTLDMNKIAAMDFTKQEHQQFAQLIGYSVSGFGSLSYVDDETYNAAQRTMQGTPELESRNAALREQLKNVKDGMRAAIADLYDIHPDDLGG